MIRLLIVLAVVGIAAVMLNYRTGKDGAPPQSPQATMQQQTENVEAMEKQLQQQAAEQLKQIDESTGTP
jgi:hypothetical protein